MNIWYYIFGAVAIAYIAICVFFYIYQESFLFHPRKTRPDFAYDFEYPAEEKFYATPNNGNIHTLKFTTKQAKGIVLYLHGNAGSLRDWGWLYKDFIARNYNILFVDYRSYGKSTGPLSEKSVHADIAFIYDELKKEYAENKIIVYGRSIGTGMATHIASVRNPKTLVLETPYYSIVDIAKRIVPFLFLEPLLKYKFKSFKYIKSVKSNIYFLHGTNDNVVPYASGLRLYNTVKNTATLITVQDGQHNNLSQFNEYYTLLDKVLQ